jgi:molecular chaperone GrpE
VIQPESEKEQESKINETETIDKSDTEQLKKALEEEKSKCQVNLERWQRAQADFINYKRYAEQEKLDNCKFASTNLILNILPVVDDFERALEAVPQNEIRPKWLDGFRLIYNKFQDVLKKQGVEPVNALGEGFDPRFMDAISCGRGKKDIVLMELEKGYKLYDKVIRPAKVVVGSGEEEDAIKEE